MLFFGYCKLFQFRLLLAIVSYFILSYIQLCETIIGYFWLLKGISRFMKISFNTGFMEVKNRKILENNFYDIVFGHFNVLSPYLEAKLANIMEIGNYLE